MNTCQEILISPFQDVGQFWQTKAIWPSGWKIVDCQICIGAMSFNSSNDLLPDQNFICSQRALQQMQNAEGRWHRLMICHFQVLFVDRFHLFHMFFIITPPGARSTHLWGKNMNASESNKMGDTGEEFGVHVGKYVKCSLRQRINCQPQKEATVLSKTPSHLPTLLVWV